MTVAKTRVASHNIEGARKAVEHLGWQQAVDDWREITRADDIDLVDIVTPTNTHAEIAIDALEYGKHVLCEKPLAASPADAARMYHAAQEAGAIAQAGFNYRSWPAVDAARQIIDTGILGRVLGFRGQFLHDYALDEAMPVSWRLRRARAGGGAVTDIGSHMIDLARYLVGDVERVLARSTTFYPRRPVSSPDGDDLVDVDDATDLLLEFGARRPGHILVNWMMAGHKMEVGFEVYGTHGSIRFSWEENSGRLWLHQRNDHGPANGFASIVLGPQHGDYQAFWPLPGVGLGLAESYVIQAARLLKAILQGDPAGPSFLDGLRVAEVVDAAIRSADHGEWVTVDRHTAGRARVGSGRPASRS
jgi:predicted dehydrogenase